jgi:hypothetical protein
MCMWGMLLASYILKVVIALKDDDVDSLH